VDRLAADERGGPPTHGSLCHSADSPPGAGTPARTAAGSRRRVPSRVRVGAGSGTSTGTRCRRRALLLKQGGEIASGIGPCAAGPGSQRIRGPRLACSERVRPRQDPSGPVRCRRRRTSSALPAAPTTVSPTPSAQRGPR
jgi:hypothetical protein